MPSIKNLERRIKSVEGTRQITQAMELVAISKMVRAKEYIDRTRPYFLGLYGTLSDTAHENTDFSSDYTYARTEKKALFILIAGDRGLAGAYNSNIFKLVEKESENISSVFLPIGKKAFEYCQKTGKELFLDIAHTVEDMDVSASFQAGQLLAEGYLSRKFDAVHIVYTNFTSMLEQTPAILKLLPIFHEKSEKPEKPRPLIIYDPNTEEVFNAIVPGFLGGIIYAAVCEAAAAELAARRSAMNTATENAEEMLSDLSLQYNRARQGKITQEIVEIVAGGEK